MDSGLILLHIKELINDSGLSCGKFADKIGMDRSGFSKRINGHVAIGDAVVNKIVLALGVSKFWLTTGEGEKYLNPEIIEIHKSVDFGTSATDMLFLKDKHFIGASIPVYNAEASAGCGALRLNNEFIIGKMNVPFASEGDKALTVIGESMVPVVNSGDILVVRERKDWCEYLELGKMYVIVTSEEVFVKVINGDNGGRVVLHSYNLEYPDFSVPKECISNIFKVVGIVSQRSF